MGTPFDFTSRNLIDPKIGKKLSNLKKSLGVSINSSSKIHLKSLFSSIIFWMRLKLKNKF